MNSISLQYQKLEANLQRLRSRVPELPTSNILLNRLLLHLGKGMAILLETKIRPAGLNEAEFRVLMTLFSQPEGCAHPGDLCSKTSQSPANMSRISDALVGRDLITRIASVRDRRKMELHITARGEQLVRALLPTIHGPLREIFQDFSDEEQIQLIEQLKRIGARLDRALSQPGVEPAPQHEAEPEQ